MNHYSYLARRMMNTNDNVMSYYFYSAHLYGEYK